MDGEGLQLIVTLTKEEQDMCNDEKRPLEKHSSHNLMKE